MSSESGTLHILNANQNDSAKYICRASNNYGQPVIASAFIDVRMRSRVLQAPQHTLLKVNKIDFELCGGSKTTVFKRQTVVS